MLLQSPLSEQPLRRADVALHVQVVLRVGDDQQLQLLLVEDHEVTSGDGAGRHPAPLQHDPLGLCVVPDL